MIRGFRRWMVVAIAIALLAGVVSILTRAAHERSPTAVASEMRGELGEIRGSLNECLAVQDRLEREFDELARTTGRLRAEIDELESLDPRGVPAERYEAYLELVDEYNEAIPEWEDRAEILRGQSSRCRALVEVHNERADSLRRFLLDEGLLEEAWID